MCCILNINIRMMITSTNNTVVTQDYHPQKHMKMMKIIKRILGKLKSLGAAHKTLMRVNNGELRITKKGKVKNKK